MKIYELKRGEIFTIEDEDTPEILQVPLQYLGMDGMYAKVQFVNHGEKEQKFIDQQFCEGSSFFALSCGTEVKKNPWVFLLEGNLIREI